MNKVEENIATWIDALSIPRPELDNMPVCPFAKKAKYKIVELTNEEIDPDFSSVEIIIYIVDSSYTFAQVENLSKKYNEIFSKLIFLPDSNTRYSYVGDIQSNNSKYNLILCQERKELQIARNKLSQTTYYKHWDEDYLKEILEQ